MKSWKKERYRRQKLFIEIKKHRQFAKDMKVFSDSLIKMWQSSIITHLGIEEEKE